MLEHRQELNPEQIEAVETVDGPLLIIAGAGSGKTRVITYRIAHMLEKRIPQKSLLALTFTNKAAREMEHRVRELTGRKLQGLVISTFHAFGVRILRENVGALGYRENFSIYDVADQHQLLRDTAKEINFSLEQTSTNTLLQLFSQIKTGRRDWESDTNIYKQLYDEYQYHMKLHNAVDFDDLIMLPIKLFTERPDIREQYREQYRYILVDEFQDTSRQQYDLLHHLAAGHGNVCVVGDDDQSIYSWRGADFSNITKFESDFPGLREITLARNYRSSDTILDAANGVISHNKNRKGKRLWTGIQGGKPVEVFYPEDDRQEGEWIAEMIQSLAMRDGVRYENVGVLIRTNSLSRTLEEAFLANNIPYTVSGGQSFFQRSEIKDITAYLRLMANPNDEVSLLRVLNKPRRGIGKRSLEQITELAHARNLSIYSAIEAAVHAADSPMSERAQADLSGFLDLIDRYRTPLHSGREMARTLRQFVEEIDYWGHLVSEFQQNAKVAKFKWQNIELFTDILDQYEKDPDTTDPSLFGFLNRVSLQVRDDVEEKQESGRVQLMTIHAAKGLEHDIVFVAGCEEGFIPHSRALEENPDNIEEERRLFYVAITRARQKLFLTACRQRHVMRELRESAPSPFLEEIPQHLIEYHEPEETASEDEASDYFAQLKAKLASRET
jgi:DNA helicase-2/ATP-dependent DNA helicase PcrA